METEKIVYLNKPLTKDEEDWIGILPYVNSISSAIDQGANMIAVTSKFGGGKSSVSESLERIMSNQVDSKGYNYDFLKVNLWNHLDTNCNSDVQIHKNFIYQLASQLDNYEYVSKRMSKNFGFIKLELKNKSSYILFVIMVFSLLITYFFSKYINVLIKNKIIDNDYSYLFIIGGVLIAIICGFIICSKSGILFSSSKSENNIDLEENEIIDLYRQIMLRQKNKHYVIIFEDIDRSNKREVIAKFLKEINKYYFYSTNFKEVNITFILNLKREYDFNSNLKENDSIDYNKIFDYIIDLPPINIDNYDVILRGLLTEKKINRDVIDSLDPNDILNTPGMRWIILGQNLDIREIKNRLNTVLVRYDFLKSISKKEKSAKPRFECCAVASYLMSEYPEDYNKMTEDAFENIVNQSITQTLDMEWFDKQEENYTEKFKEDLLLLLENRLIDTNYRMYYFNFPKNSTIYTLDENQVVNALLYGDIESSTIEENIAKVANGNCNLIKETISKIKQLGLKLPILVFENEILFEIACLFDYQFFQKSLSEYCNNKIKSTEVVRILNFGIFKEQTNNNANKIRNKFLDIIVNYLEDEELFSVRKSILQSEYLLKNKKLFYKPAPIIKISELKNINSIDIAAILIDYDKDAFTEELFIAYHESLMESKDNTFTEKQLSIYEQVNDDNIIEGINVYYIEFMEKFKTIIGFMEANVVVELGKYKEEYINIVNTLDSSLLTDATLNVIKDHEIYSGLNENVCNRLLEKEYMLEYILNMSNNDVQKIAFKEDTISSTIKTNREVIIKSGSLSNIRKEIIIKNLMKEYKWLFEADCPALSKSELESGEINSIINFIDTKTINDDNYKVFVQYFNSSYRNPRITYLIIKLISSLEDNLVVKSFYILDMNNVRYNTMSKENLANSLKLFYEKLMLSDYIEALKFMEFTSCLYTSLEKIIAPYVKDEKIYYEQYDNAIRGYKKLTQQTIENIKVSSIYRTYNAEIEAEFFKIKLYQNYIVSKTMREHNFFIEHDKIDILYKDYIKVYNVPGFKEVRKLMGENNEFLLLIIQKEDLYNIKDAYLLPFSSLNQGRTLLKRAFTMEEEFTEQYFTRVLGFDGLESAQYYVNTITDGNHNSMLKNGEIYANLHEKLIDPNLKRKYTRDRNDLIK